MPSPRMPFQTRISHFRFPAEPCILPFVVGSATQHNPAATRESQNSQDSACILISRTHIVGVVTDGCSGTHADLEMTSRSSNEVGAKLLAYLVAHSAMRLALTRHRKLGTGYLEKLSARVMKALRGVLRVACRDDKDEEERFILDFLMATVLGFVVTKRRYIVFHSGDGLIGIDGTMFDLHEHAGEYFANDMVVRASKSSLGMNSFKQVSSGETHDLRSIFLATDGLSRIATQYPEHLADFTVAEPNSNQTNNGVDFLLQEFRQKIGWNPVVDVALEDDATFVLLRRYQPEDV